MEREFFFFTEMGYTAYPQDEAKEMGYNNLMVPNEHFSPEKAQGLYSMYFDELQYCTEAGFDGVMINEHHNNPLCMMPSVNVIGSVLASRTKQGKIVFLGNVLPIHDNPLRVAEEMMIDILSGGRVVCGFVRGIGQESMATNTNPLYNRERFDEAHNVIVGVWIDSALRGDYILPVSGQPVGAGGAGRLTKQPPESNRGREHGTGILLFHRNGLHGLSPTRKGRMKSFGKPSMGYLTRAAATGAREQARRAVQRWCRADVPQRALQEPGDGQPGHGHQEDDST